MKSHADAELEAMLADLESDCVERKQSFRGDAPTTVREAVCAFANDLPGHETPGRGVHWRARRRHPVEGST
jgi:ATP-dependent DNA helicase RecG